MSFWYNSYRDRSDDMYKKRLEEENKKRELIKQKLKNWLPSELAKQPQILLTYQAEWELLKKSHHIEFSRYGDFISVKQSLNGFKTIKAIQLIREFEKNEKGYSTVLKPASITYLEGREPNMLASGYARSYDGDVTNFSLDLDYQHFGYYGDGTHVYVDTGVAHPQVYDRISFDGSGVVLEVPHGLGQQAYEDLLKVLGE